MLKEDPKLPDDIVYSLYMYNIHAKEESMEFVSDCSTYKIADDWGYAREKYSDESYVVIEEIRKEAGKLDWRKRI